jgi:GTP diphosphokinase / guanosine-3',5'-bis(diphosphate) 3'-diphosphatase
MTAISQDTCQARFDELLKNMPKLTPDQRKFISNAYACAFAAHGDQKRASGEPYMIHPIAVAQILAELKLDYHTIAAALLHDVAEDSKTITLQHIEADFGQEVAMLVDGVTKLDKLPVNDHPANGSKPKNRDTETLRKIFLTMNKDIRVVLIKLADRLHNMLTLGHLSPERQQRMAEETRTIFAPLANRLGIWQIKWQLEDLSLRYLNPEIYKQIATQLDEKRADRERDMGAVRDKLAAKLAENGIEAQVTARPKHIYSIYAKMERKKVDLTKIYDVRAVRIIVNDVPTCYYVLGIIHAIGRPLPGEFDDYIAAPKESFYQSLHTAIVDDTGKNLEVQIRTWEMHENAEYGIAAHWRYKEGSTNDPMFEKRLEKMRRSMDFMDGSTATEGDASQVVEAIKSDVLQDQIYVFSPKGDLYDLPLGSTPIDFAYHVHTDIGHRCRGAKVNDVQVSLAYKLKASDRVEILITKRGGPSLDWLNEDLQYTRTNRAKTKIREWFKRQDRENNIVLGRDTVDRELKRLALLSIPKEVVAGLFNFQRLEDFFAQVGSGEITSNQIATKVLASERGKDQTQEMLIPTGAPKSSANVTGGISMGKESSYKMTLAKCCSPVPGDSIIGYIGVAGKGITVHRNSCSNLRNVKDKARLHKLSWESQPSGDKNGDKGNDKSGDKSKETKEKRRMYSVPVIITAYDREGLMADVGGVIADENINMTQVRIDTQNSIATFSMVMEMRDLNQLSRVLGKIERLGNVIEARRRAG